MEYAPNAIVAEMIASALRSENIPVLLKKPRLADFPTSPGNPQDVMVPRELEAKARQFLERAEDEE